MQLISAEIGMKPIRFSQPILTSLFLLLQASAQLMEDLAKNLSEISDIFSILADLSDFSSENPEG